MDNEEKKNRRKSKESEQDSVKKERSVRILSEPEYSSSLPAQRTGSDESIDFSIESVRQYLQDKLGFYVDKSKHAESSTSKRKKIDNLTFDGLVNYWKKNGFKNIITMVGAGISTSAGIPDFRSPKSGLYDNLKKYNLPNPQAIFAIEYFRQNPEPFYKLAKELYPSETVKPTISHYFVKLLQKKGLLVRHYTQNIDGLERLAGIKSDLLVEAHGQFYTNKCLKCGKEYDMEWVKEKIFSDTIPICIECNDVVKPDIVFFGENLPLRFHTLPNEDFKKCDLLIIMGTSLEVQPFASLIDYANENCIRLLINRDRVGCKSTNLLSSWFQLGDGLFYDNPQENTRDIAIIDDCDKGVMSLAEALGWGDELKDLIAKEHIKLDKKRSGIPYKSSSEEEEQNEEKETEVKFESSIKSVSSDDTLKSSVKISSDEEGHEAKK